MCRVAGRAGLPSITLSATIMPRVPARTVPATQIIAATTVFSNGNLAAENARNHAAITVAVTSPVALADQALAGVSALVIAPIASPSCWTAHRSRDILCSIRYRQPATSPSIPDPTQPPNSPPPGVPKRTPCSNSEHLFPTRARDRPGDSAAWPADTLADNLPFGYVPRSPQPQPFI